MLLLLLGAYLVPLSWRPLIVPDEMRYAEIPREMIADGDWVVPRLNGVRYFEKPVLGYWVHAAAQMVLGPTAFAVRLPSAVATLGTGALLWLVARRSGRGGPGAPDAAPRAAAVVFLTSGQVYAIGTYAVLDALFSACVTASLVCFFCGCTDSRGVLRAAGGTAWLLVAGAGAGAAFLVKGFAGLAIIGLTAVSFLLWQRIPGRRWLALGAWPVGAFLVVSLPWAVAIHLREPDFWPSFIQTEHLRRFLSEEAQHREPFWYYLPLLLGGFMPWTLLLAVRPSWRLGVGPGESSTRFAVCWLALPLLFFSLCRGKLGTYILPCFPPAAWLLADGLVRVPAETLAGRLRRVARCVGLGVGAALLLAGLAFAASPALRALVVLPGSGWRLGVLAGAGGCWVAAWWWVGRGTGPLQSRDLQMLWVSLLPLCLASHGAWPNARLAERMPGHFLARWAARVPPDALVVTDARMVHAVTWTLRRADAYIVGARGELKYGLDYPEAASRQIEQDALGAWLDVRLGRGPVVIAMDVDRFALVVGQLPPGGRREEAAGVVTVIYDTAGADAASRR